MQTLYHFFSPVLCVHMHFMQYLWPCVCQLCCHIIESMPWLVPPSYFCIPQLLHEIGQKKNKINLFCVVLLSYHMVCCTYLQNAFLFANCSLKSKCPPSPLENITRFLMVIQQPENQLFYCTWNFGGVILSPEFKWFNSNFVHVV